MFSRIPLVKICLILLGAYFLCTAIWSSESRDARMESGAEGNDGERARNEIYKIIVDRDEARLYLYKSNECVKTYLVAVGNVEMGKPTPAGRFKIVSKVKDPFMIWRSGRVIPANDPRNSYGPRWIGLGDHNTGTSRGCGIQGTNAESSIGKRITIGCIRMYNSDIIELFDFVDLGTEVIVR